MKILVVAPHMDDEAIGMGGTIVKHIDAGAEVHVVIVAHRVYNHVFDSKANDEEKKATLNAKDALGYHHVSFLDLPDERLDHCIQEILIPLEDSVMAFKPDVLYTSFYGDNNQDHRAVFEAVRVIARPASGFKIKRFLAYEVPSSTEQSPPLLHNTFTPNYFVDIQSSMDRKLKALSCYEREQRTFPHPRSEQGLRVLAQMRGMESGFEYAEAFVLLRDEWT